MKNINNGDLPAFPQSVSIDIRGELHHTDSMSSGLSTREYCAIQIMQGLLVNSQKDCNPPEQIIHRAVFLTDKLLEELEK